MKELTYADIRKMALEHGIKDTRLHIGLWASDRYVKKRKMIQSESDAGFIQQSQDYVKIKGILLFMKMI